MNIQKKLRIVFILAAMLVLLFGVCSAEGVENLRVYIENDELLPQKPGEVYVLKVGSEHLNVSITGMDGAYPYRLTLSGLSEINPESLMEGYSTSRGYPLPKGYFTAETVFDASGNAEFQINRLSAVAGTFGPFKLQVSCGNQALEWNVILQIRQEEEDYYDMGDFWWAWDEYPVFSHMGDMDFVSLYPEENPNKSVEFYFEDIADGGVYYGVQGGTLDSGLIPKHDHDEVTVELREAATGNLIASQKTEVYADCSGSGIFNEVTFKSGAEYILSASDGSTSDSVRFTLIEEPTPMPEQLTIQTLGPQGTFTEIENLGKDGIYTVYGAADHYAHFIAAVPDREYPCRLKISGSKPNGEAFVYTDYFVDSGSGGQEYRLHAPVYISGTYGPYELEISCGSEVRRYNVQFVESVDSSLLHQLWKYQTEKAVNLNPLAEYRNTLNYFIDYTDEDLHYWVYNEDAVFYGRPGYGINLDIYGKKYPKADKILAEIRRADTGDVLCSWEGEIWGKEGDWLAGSEDAFILPEGFISGEYELVVLCDGEELGRKPFALIEEPQVPEV